MKQTRGPSLQQTVEGRKQMDRSWIFVGVKLPVQLLAFLGD
jgi:hypothetical protein